MSDTNSYLPTQLQEFIHISRYARWREEDNRRETWEETVSRYVAFFEAKHPETYPGAQIKDAILNLKTMPSMRALMTAGKALDRDNVASFNCSYLAIDHPKAFDEALYILMCGTGLGFSVERQYIANLPEVADSFYRTESVIVVADSKIGWASSYRELITLLYSGQIPKWDVSKVRPSGARLKTFGGRASGPKPLEDLFRFTIDTFVKAAGRKLTSVECHDLVCKVADIVVVGGVRRSALISLSNLSDDRMRVAKSGQWWESNPQRALANNSAAYAEKPDIELFMKEWLSLIESKSGERGIFNRVSAKKKAAESGRRDTSYDLGTNPCLTPDMRILTSRGHVAIGELIGKETSIWNGFEYSTVTPFSTGINPIWEVSFSNGSVMKVTPYHKFILSDGSRVEAQKLIIGNAIQKFILPTVLVDNTLDVEGYSQGFYSGDGCTDSKKSYIYEPKYRVIPRLMGMVQEDGDGSRNRKVWIHGDMQAKTYIPFQASSAYIRNWIAGLLDADATVIKNPTTFGIQLGSIDQNFLDEVRMLLVTLGVQSKVTAEGRTEKKFEGYNCQPFFRLHISCTGVRQLLDIGVQFARLEIDPTFEVTRDASRFVTVSGIKDLGYEQETFCLTEPKNHSMIVEGLMTAQCGEILLRSCGFCNLTEVVLRAEDTLEDILRKVETATIMGTYQSTLTNFRYLRPIWKKNAEEERLLGVSLTGIMDHPVLSKVTDEAKAWLLAMRDQAVAVNKVWAEKLGINQSVAITTVKPSGTVSQLVDSASGIHPRYAEYYIRTVRADKKDPLAIMMRDVGFPVEDDFMKPTTGDVFSFPVKGPEHGVFRNDMTAIEQLEHYLMFKQVWCEHNPSITVYVRDHEWLEVGAWVYKNFDDVGGVSFLPHSDHSYSQPPYDEVTEAQYLELLAKMPNVDWSVLQQYEKTDSTTSTKELSCTAGICELI